MPLKNKVVDKKLVEKILEQGQKLRNSMIESILKNDPLSKETVNDKHHNTPQSSSSSILTFKLHDLGLADEVFKEDFNICDKVYLNKLDSEHFKVCDSNEKSVPCSCATCVAYSIKCLKCDLRRIEITDHKNIPIYTNQKCLVNTDVLKYGDCLKVNLHTIYLNNQGLKILTHNLSKTLQRFNEIYFVEYSIPKGFLANVTKTKINTGLENNTSRICARRSNDVIPLKKTFVHDVYNLAAAEAEQQSLNFIIKYKNPKTKTFQLLGIAKFYINTLIHVKDVTCSKALPVYLTETSPVLIGTLKVTIQLGCGRVFFGKEFVDAITSKYKTDTPEIIENIESNVNHNNWKHESQGYSSKKHENKGSTCRPITNINVSSKIIKTSHQDKAVKSVYFNNNEQIENKEFLNPKLEKEIEDSLLFGFIYISEAQFSYVQPNSYIICQPYCQTDQSFSKIIYDSQNPLYNFCQIVPLLYDDQLLQNLRENFMVIEFWDKGHYSSKPFGLTTVPLHQFYVAYRNISIFRHLQRNKLPIIGTDWWEPINSTNDETVIGQVQLLTALGTQEQIKNLKIERGFKAEEVKAKFLNSVEIKDKPKSNSASIKRVIKKSDEYLKHKSQDPPSGENKENFRIGEQKIDKVNKAIQSDIESTMDFKKDFPNTSQTQEILSSFLKHLEQKSKPVFVEHGTNTDAPFIPSAVTRLEEGENVHGTNIGKTSDLLDTLQKAITLGGPRNKKIEKPPSVRVEISINSANQLPSRRKLKSKCKRIKSKSLKQDDTVMPSTYVTFETVPGEPVQMTKVFPKSVSPQWNYKCDVNLPLDLVINGQKRLIFKVWKKSTNTVLQPNTQTDVVLGFAAVDISVLMAGLPNIQGWFNITDFSGKCNGQINIHINPLENVQKAFGFRHSACNGEEKVSIRQFLPTSSSGSDEGNEPLSRALKRKFTELDEITQRLRLRLSEVVQEDSEVSDDDMADQFESDINNLCIEEDFHLINFEEEARKFNKNYNSQRSVGKNDNPKGLLCITQQIGTPSEKNVSSSEEERKSDALVKGVCQNDDWSGTSKSSLDRELVKGKERIDNLLEKLTLVTADSQSNFSSRNVSGCSVNKENVRFSNEIWKSDVSDKSTLTESHSMDVVSGGSDKCESSSKLEIVKSTDGSETSVITNFSIDSRPNPDGQGSIIE